MTQIWSCVFLSEQFSAEIFFYLDAFSFNDYITLKIFKLMITNIFQVEKYILNENLFKKYKFIDEHPCWMFWRSYIRNLKSIGQLEILQIEHQMQALDQEGEIISKKQRFFKTHNFRTTKNYITVHRSTDRSRWKDSVGKVWTLRSQ